MIKIVSDSSTLYSKEEAKKNNLDVRSLSVTIDNKSFKELEELTTEGLVKLIEEGAVPSSSQPAIGDVVEMYEEYPDAEIINISMADGLSGTYQSACMAKTMVDHGDNITVINSKTLCGPHRYLVDVAVKLVEAGKTKSEIISEVEALIETSTSFLIPKDFDYLVRGGRLSPLVGRIGGLVKLVPVMTLSEDCTRLEKFATKRTFKKAIQAICEDFTNKGVNEEYKIYISHACDEELALSAKEMIEKQIANTEIEVILLTPVFTTQGGPGCVAIQAIKKHDILK
ncbi:MAG: DegV family protein [Turicibacter sp.]|nr:DegV family protein [Turicibacter sp.]MEE0880763.1 DegV family protein [Turicibacter sp.]